MTTLFLAKLVGVYSLVMALSMGLQKKIVMEVFREVFKHRALSYIMGVVMLIVSLYLILTQLPADTTVSLVLLLIGCGIFIESLVYLFAGQKLLAKEGRMIQQESWYYTVALGYFALGLYLMYVSYGV